MCSIFFEDHSEAARLLLIAIILRQRLMWKEALSIGFPLPLKVVFLAFKAGMASRYLQRLSILIRVEMSEDAGETTPVMGQDSDSDT